jgi:hypothetical protein
MSDSYSLQKSAMQGFGEGHTGPPATRDFYVEKQVLVSQIERSKIDNVFKNRTKPLKPDFYEQTYPLGIAAAPCHVLKCGHGV